MPSIIHESLVDLFRDSPALAPELISCAGTELPGRQRTPRLTAAEFADLKADEYRADAVIRLDAGDNTPSDIIIVEVQLKRDVDKRVSWPMYMAGARARYRCPATILVITIDPGVAQWCARPIVLDPQWKHDQTGRCGPAADAARHRPESGQQNPGTGHPLGTCSPPARGCR